MARRRRSSTYAENRVVAEMCAIREEFNFEITRAEALKIRNSRMAGKQKEKNSKTQRIEKWSVRCILDLAACGCKLYAKPDRKKNPLIARTYWSETKSESQDVLIFDSMETYAEKLGTSLEELKSVPYDQTWDIWGQVSISNLIADYK